MMASNLRLGYNKQIKQDGEMQSIKKLKHDGAESATVLKKKIKEDRKCAKYSI
jgi:hypothetical protein